MDNDIIVITQKQKIIRELTRLVEKIEDNNTKCLEPEHYNSVDDLNTVISWIDEQL